MVSVSTRLIGTDPKDLFDAVAIKDDLDNYVGKWGILKLTLTSITWTASSAQAISGVTLDVRVPGHNDLFDTPIVNAVPLPNSQGSINMSAVPTGYLYSINNGVPGPAAFIQRDGTFDLMTAQLTLPAGYTGPAISVTFNYTLSFIDLTPTAPPTSPNKSITFRVYDAQPKQQFFISEPQGTFGTASGSVAVQLGSLATVTKNVTPSDSVPYFSFGTNNLQLIEHPITGFSGVKNYNKNCLAVYAINYGKGDANTVDLFTTPMTVTFAVASLQRVDDWPTRTDVTAVVSYNQQWTPITF